MKCPYLNDDIAVRCEAEDRLYVLSQSQLDKYCQAKKYKKCPLYLFMDDMNNATVKDFVTVP